MAQTFNDLCNERKQQAERGLFGLVLSMFAETAIGIIKEHILLIRQGDAMKNIISKPKSAALLAFLLFLPAMLLNTIAANEIEPFFTFFKVGTSGGFWANPIGYLAIIVCLLLLPVGGVIAIRPMIQKGADGTRRLYLINGILAAIMLVFFILVSGVLIADTPW
ncbi:MAG: hypothetical protein ACREOI_19160 [bacterium]